MIGFIQYELVKLFTREQRNVVILIYISKVKHGISPSCYPVISGFPT